MFAIRFPLLFCTLETIRDKERKCRLNDHPFIPQISVEHLLCARHGSKVTEFFFFFFLEVLALLELHAAEEGRQSINRADEVTSPKEKRGKKKKKKNKDRKNPYGGRDRCFAWDNQGRPLRGADV